MIKGLGINFNQELIGEITKVRGANYFSVNSKEQFEKILLEDFNYIVTPLLFDANLIFESDDVKIDKW